MVFQGWRWGVGDREGRANGCGVSFWAGRNRLRSPVVVVHTCVNTLKTAARHILRSEQTVRHVNCVSMKLFFTEESRPMLSYSSIPEDRRTNSRITRAGRQTAGPPGAAARRHAGVGQPREPAPKIRGGSQAPDVSAGRRATSPPSRSPGQQGTLRGLPGVRGALVICLHSQGRSSPLGRGQSLRTHTQPGP